MNEFENPGKPAGTMTGPGGLVAVTKRRLVDPPASRAHPANRFTLAAVAIAVALSAACGSNSGGSVPPDGGDASCTEGPRLDGTFAGIEQAIFERYGCAEQACHGSAAAGGLDLSPGFAWRNLVGVPSLEKSGMERVRPGDKDRSWLWLKLLAKTRPGSVQIVGAPMPLNAGALSDDELELLRMWIYAGAPEKGTVAGTEKYLTGCLPPVEPISIAPLDPPAPSEGVQFVLPPFDLAPSSEREICFATWYDLTGRVPADALDPSGEYFRYSGQELRQDPQSHHLLLLLPGFGADRLNDPSYGAWTCAGGTREGESCEPTDASACGTGGFCRSEVRDLAGCIGFGPRIGQASGVDPARQFGGAQASNAYQSLRPGVFGQAPIKGIVYWNAHAFNLTSNPHRLNGRINFLFSRDSRFPVQPIFDTSNIFKPNAAPFTTGTTCGKHLLPQGTRLFGLTSHTHRRGKRFWVTAPDGTQIFENTIYNDPTKQVFEPPLEFDSPDPAERTLDYCAFFNNGVAADGSPDPEAVTRASRVPESAYLAGIGPCRPIACVSGRVGAACNGVGDDRACDSAPGANDGFCDACAITGGESTENEMLILIGQAYIDEKFPQPPADGLLLAGLASVGKDGSIEAGR